jgi:hypothetical protein
MQSLVVINLDEARYECTYGRGCDGVCCQVGRPIVYPEEIANLDAHLPRLLPLLRPAARRAIRQKGYLTRRGQSPRLRHAAGWCVFFHNGCVLHKVGVAEGDKFKYKPALCSLFPLQQDRHDRWYVRQKGFNGERWDLFCLDPANHTKPAAESLRDELALAALFQAAADSATIPNENDAEGRPWRTTGTAIGTPTTAR